MAFNVMRACEKCGRWFNQKVESSYYERYPQEAHSDADEFFDDAKELACTECRGGKKVKKRDYPKKKSPKSKRSR